MVCFSCICDYVSSTAGGLLTQMHEKHTIKTACTKCLPDDEHKMFETRRRHQELN